MANVRIPIDNVNKGLAFRVTSLVDMAAELRAASARLMPTLNAYDSDTAALAADLGGGISAAQAATLRTILGNFDQVVNSDAFVRSDTKTGRQALDELISDIDQG